MMTDPSETQVRPSDDRFSGKRRTLVLAAAGLLALGGGAGAVAMQATRPSVTMAPVTPVAINALGSSGIVTVRGRVAEIYGNKFVIADATGRALVDTGPEGEGGKLVGVNQTVTVQGRFDDGSIHAAFLVGADGKVEALGPLAGPPPHDRHGPPHGRRGPDCSPPPVPAAAVAAPGSASLAPANSAVAPSGAAVPAGAATPAK